MREVTGVRDDTDLNGLKLTVDYRPSADPELLVQKLFKVTSMQSNFSCNFNLLIKGKPKVLGVRDILFEWLDWRRECLSNEYSFEIDENKKNYIY